MQSGYLRDGGAAKGLGIRGQSGNRRPGAEARDRHYADSYRCVCGVMQTAYWLLGGGYIPIETVRKGESYGQS